MYIEDRSFILTDDASILEAIASLNNTGYLITIIVDHANVLRGTITDGDIRRGLLAGKSPSDLATEIMCTDPIFSHVSSTLEQNKHLSIEYQVKQLPIVDDKHRIQSLYIRERNEKPARKENQILIMAGGFGKRMLPLTTDVPKPMLEISGKPILEHILCNARSQGFYSFFISVHHLRDQIMDYFGDGSKWGLEIEYIEEDQPLGTAGCLSLFKSKSPLPLIVTNGDIYTDINLSAILKFHISNNASATMAVKRQLLQNPFGVVQTRGIEIVTIVEKPIETSYVNSGLYVLDPSNLHLLERNSFCDMPNFFRLLKNNSKKIIAFPIYESWTDIGRPVDLHKINHLDD